VNRLGTTITVKVTPEQFDYIRKLLERTHRENLAVVRDKRVNAKHRAEARNEAAKAGFLLEYLNRS
jgi:hypothetical protein